MKDILISPRLYQQHEKIKKKAAKLSDEQEQYVEKFMSSTDPNFIVSVLETIEKDGHPFSIGEAKKIKDKYQKENLDFSDISSFLSICKANSFLFQQEEWEDE